MNDCLPARSCLVALCLAMLVACSGQTEAPIAAIPAGDAGSVEAPVDFSGSWELDYGRSDNVQAEFDSMVRDVRRAQERRQGGMNQGAARGITIGGAGNNRGEALVGVARMAEMVTSSPLLEVKQDERKVTVKREENFSLVCEFHPGQVHTVETPFGTESCGWQGHQLTFRIALPDGLNIQHVMTLGAQGRKLNIATTVVSGQVSYPFTLNRVYNKFEPGESGYRCTMTLTRGRVCTTEAP